MDKGYLAKGLLALSRSMEKDIWAGHLGAAVIAAYYFLRHNEHTENMQDLITNQTDSFIEVHKDFFKVTSTEEENLDFEIKIISALEENIEKLCEIGHNVIYASLALKASRDVPEMRTTIVCEGMCHLISAFNDCTPGHIWVDGKTEVIEPDNTDTIVPRIEDAGTVKKYVLDSFLNAERSYREESGDMQLGHLLTHGQSIVELFELGYSELGQVAFKPFAQRIKLIKGLRKRNPCIDPSEGVGNFISPLKDEYWSNDYSDSDWNHGHIFKYPYSFYQLLKDVEYTKIDALEHKFALLQI